jgi:Protein of unknown function (DUF465)
MPDKHDLHSEFPEFKEQIHQLKQHNNHFTVLFNRYHEIDHEIHRIEQGVYPSDLKMRVSEPLGACNARQPGEAMSTTLRGRLTPQCNRLATPKGRG